MNFNSSLFYLLLLCRTQFSVTANLQRLWESRARTREGKREIYKDGVRVVWAAYIDGVERNITGHGERVLSWRDGCCGWHHAERVESSQKPLPVNVLCRPACIQNGEREALRLVHKTVCKAVESSGAQGFLSFHGVTHDTHSPRPTAVSTLLWLLCSVMFKDKPKKCFQLCHERPSEKGNKMPNVITVD